MWKPTVKRFFLRFLVSMVLIGGLYVATVGPRPKNPARSHSATSQLSIMRGQLDETLIESSSLAQFKRSDPATSNSLGQIVAAYQRNGADLAASSRKSGHLLNPGQLNTVKQVRTAQKQALDRYQASFSVVSRVLSYDPAIDLGKLPIDSKASVMSSRATAAANGLRHAANANGVTSSGLNVGTATDSSQLLNTSAQSTLTDEAACFERLASQLDSHQSELARETLSTCTDSYGKVRLVAARAVTNYSFGPEYQQYLKQRLPGLLEELNGNNLPRQS